MYLWRALAHVTTNTALLNKHNMGSKCTPDRRNRRKWGHVYDKVFCFLRLFHTLYNSHRLLLHPLPKFTSTISQLSLSYLDGVHTSLITADFAPFTHFRHTTHRVVILVAFIRVGLTGGWVAVPHREFERGRQRAWSGRGQVRRQKWAMTESGGGWLGCEG